MCFNHEMQVSVSEVRDLLQNFSHDKSTSMDGLSGVTFKFSVSNFGPYIIYFSVSNITYYVMLLIDKFYTIVTTYHISYCDTL